MDNVQFEQPNKNIKIKDDKKNNVLKADTLLTKDQYNQELINKDYNNLYMKSTEQNIEEKKKKASQKIYNLSIKEIISNASETYVNILNDFTNLVKKKELTMTNIVNLITLDDRLIYVGILIVVIALLFAFVFVAD